MNWFNNLGISTKLIAAFLIVSGITGVVGYLGIANMGKLNEAAESLYQRELLGVSHVKQANIELMYVARAMRNVVLAGTEEMRRKNVEAVEVNLKKVQASMEQAHSRFSSAEGKKLLADFASQWVQYEAAVRKALALASAEKLAEHRESVAFINGEMRSHAEQLDDTFASLSKNKETRAASSAAGATAMYNDSRQLMLGIAIGGVVIGMMLGLFISRGITRPLGESVRAANRMAEGDFTVKLEARSKDEVGQLML